MFLHPCSSREKTKNDFNCKLCDPTEAFLLSSAGIGSLNKILNNLERNDLLDFGEGKKIKKMQVAKWDLYSNSLDFVSLVPKI